VVAIKTSQLIEDFTSQIATSALDLATSSTLGDNDDDRNTAAPKGGNVTDEGNSANDNTSDTGDNNTTRATTTTSNSVTRDTDFINDYDETADDGP
jgi:hypothetical protein